MEAGHEGEHQVNSTIIIATIIINVILYHSSQCHSSRFPPFWHLSHFMVPFESTILIHAILTQPLAPLNDDDSYWARLGAPVGLSPEDDYYADDEENV